MAKREKPKPPRLFLLTVRDQQQNVRHVVHNYDYTSLIVQGMDLARACQGAWDIFDSFGKFVDGGVYDRRVTR